MTNWGLYEIVTRELYTRLHKKASRFPVKNQQLFIKNSKKKNAQQDSALSGVFWKRQRKGRNLLCSFFYITKELRKHKRKKLPISVSLRGGRKRSARRGTKGNTFRCNLPVPSIAICSSIERLYREIAPQAFPPVPRCVAPHNDKVSERFFR